jgi:cell division septal protein FtsQ
MLLFAFIVSLGFAFLSRRRLRSRIRYLLWAFLAFLMVAITIGWIMYPASH